MAEKIKLAILGAVIFVKESHVPAINQLIKEGRVVVKAIYSRTQDSAEDVKKKLNCEGIDVYFGDEEKLREMLKREDIDTCDIALPINMLPSAIQLCLSHGKHVLSEKPIAPTVQMGKALVLVYELKYASKLVWSVAENIRHYPSFKRAAKEIKEGTIGRLLSCNLDARSAVLEDNKYYNTEWRKDPKYQGGFLFDGGVHHAAIIRMMMGEAASVCAQMTKIREWLPPFDTLTASIKFQNGAMGSSLASYANKVGNLALFSVFGENGTIKVTKSELEITEFLPDGGTRVTKPQLKPENCIYEEILTFFDEIQRINGRTPFSNIEFVNTAKQGLQDIALIEAILESGKKEQVLKVENVSD